MKMSKDYELLKKDIIITKLQRLIGKAMLFLHNIEDVVHPHAVMEVHNFKILLSKTMGEIIEEEITKEYIQLVELAEMVRDNTKMPHQHTDPQLRLYCLAERADEILGGRK